MRHSDVGRVQVVLYAKECSAEIPELVKQDETWPYTK